jgi:Ca2+-binding RTX toxin-like protein
MVSITGGLGSSTPSTVLTTITDSQQINTLQGSVQNLLNDYKDQGLTSASVNIQGVSSAFSRVHPVPGGAIAGDVNIVNADADSFPATDNMFTMGNKWQGVILSGTRSVEIVGRPGNPNLSGFDTKELLVGNAGNDTIRGGGGSGTIISGSGANEIHTGKGDFIVDSDGTDKIYTGPGIDNVETRGAATVFAGSGYTIFTDKSSGSEAIKVKGDATAPGTLIAYSGLGKDTFVGGSGFNYFVDANTAGSSGVTFKFNAATGGTTIIQGLNSKDTLLLNGFGSLSATQVASEAVSYGGNLYLDLGGTRIEFLGVTSINATITTT